MSDRKTVVEEGTTLQGRLESNCPVVVMGRVEGEITGPAVEVMATGVITGKIKATSIRSRGELAGEFEADDIELGGRVRDKAVLRAKALSVILADEDNDVAPEMVLGECELRVGDEPSKEEAIAEALAPPKQRPAPAATGIAPTALTTAGDTGPHSESTAPSV